MKKFRKLFLCLIAYALCLMPFLALAATLDLNSPKTIVSDKIEYDARGKIIQTRGKTTVTTASGQVMHLGDTRINMKTQDVSGNTIEMFLGRNIRVTAETLDKTGANTRGTMATYTACWLCDKSVNAWEITADKFAHSTETNMMEFDNMVFWFYGVPVFWSPYLTHPDPKIRHKSGLLFPDFNSTNGMGIRINIPMYVAFSDSHDLTLTISPQTRESPLWQAEHRLDTNHMRFRTNGSFTHDLAGMNRWHISNRDTIEMGDNVRMNIFLDRTSDKTYLQRYGFYKDQPYLDSGLRTEFFEQRGYATAEAHFFQELRSGFAGNNYINPSGDILPRIRGVYQTQPLWYGAYANLTGDLLGVQNTGAGTVAQRLIGEGRMTMPLDLPFGQRVEASTSMRYDIYNFGNTDMIGGGSFTGVKTRFLPSGYIDWSLPFIKTGDDWTQVIRPRARLTLMDHLNYMPVFAVSNDSAGAMMSDAAMFSTNRLSGYDLWGNGNYADYGLQWTGFSNSGYNAEAFFGQSYDFSKPLDTDPNSGFYFGTSDYVGRASVGLDKNFFVSNRFRLNKNNLSLRHLESVARIGSRNYVDVGYIYATQFIDAQTQGRSIHEVVAGFGVHLTDRWSMLSRTTYNITDGRLQKQSASILYDHPCYSIELEVAKDGAIRYDYGGKSYVGNTTFHLRFNMKINGTETVAKPPQDQEQDIK